MRDSLGVPMEPEDNEVAKDWLGEGLYENDVVYMTEDGLVNVDDMKEYIGFVYGAPMSVDEYMLMLRESSDR